MPDSFALLANNEQAAYVRADRRGCSLPLPVPDATGRYCGSLLPTVRAGMADVNQVSSCVGTVVVQEMYHCSTSARPSHGRSQPGWRWLSARSQACVRSRRAGTPPDAPLASPGSARQPLDLLSVAVWVAQFPVAWLLTPQLGESDTLPDDVPAIPPGLLQDFSTSGTCPHTG